MRNGGNDHASSWLAAYQSLKNERGGLFKISPRQAATIIVQQVVGSPDTYKDCIQHLGDLYPKNEEDLEGNVEEKKVNKGYVEDRYSY
ncbi:Predicted membrane protein [Prochlorococcus marinus subsp. marinus str. CCMP1375]|uniref:Predicted membrane protein n=2 Tax=Prochlorococcaceae TaxID=2881426 RepID=Q7VEI0_PROMA|nr:Predicted membrane protein [Prochlorococcus marinus subsp. marinus str. CCMP1375]